MQTATSTCDGWLTVVITTNQIKERNMSNGITKVRVIKRITERGETRIEQQRLFDFWMRCPTDTGEYELRPYTNQKNGLPDPQVVEPESGRWLQVSTAVEHQGYSLVDAVTGDDVVVENLSPW